MKDPDNNKRNWIADVIIILLIVILAYVLYSLIGGDLSSITRMGKPGDPGPFGGVADSVGAFGQGLKDMFGNIAP